MHFQASRQDRRSALVQPVALLGPSITDLLHLIAIEHQISTQHGAGAGLVGKELNLLLDERIADSDIRHRREERRLADQRMRIAMTAMKFDMPNVPLRDEKLPVPKHVIHHGVAAEAIKYFSVAVILVSHHEG